MKLRNWLSALVCGMGLLTSTAMAEPAKSPPVKPKLVIVISVDQFAFDLYERYVPTYTGGLSRMSQGLVFTGYQSHGATETCPGHSTLLTGQHPAKTGIVANYWYDRNAKQKLYCVAVPEATDAAARGHQNLKVDTLGDWLKAAVPEARSMAVSGKDRAAIMMGGHHADAVYWWAGKKGFTSSSYAGPVTAQTVAPSEAFNAELFKAWASNPPSLWPHAVPERCQALVKPHQFGNEVISGKVPPESAIKAETGQDYLSRPQFYDEFTASAALDPVTLAFAAQIIDTNQLGRGQKTDLLAVSLSATDYVGHHYGNGGAEMCVQINELDASLQQFFAHVDALNVPYMVVLTADHGAIDAPERLGPPAQRIDTVPLMAKLNATLRLAYHLSYDPIIGADPHQPLVLLAPADEHLRPALTQSAVLWLKAQPSVADAFRAADVARAKPAKAKSVKDLTLAERFYESYDAERSGDILVAYTEGATLGVPEAMGDTVAGHGSPWDYDRRVPILIWWPGIAGQKMTKPMETVDIAPTLAAAIGIKAPRVDGHCVEIGQHCPKH